MLPITMPNGRFRRMMTTTSLRCWCSRPSKPDCHGRLNKRKRFRQAFDGFDIERIRRYDENKIAELMNDPGIIRNRRKIVATVGNANAFRDIQTSYGSFDDYIWRFTGRHVIYETGMTTSPLSDAIAVDLKTYGMRFIGTTIVYAYLQSIGVINAHEPGCFLHRER